MAKSEAIRYITKNIGTTMRKSILCIGTDTALLESRCLLLKHAGYLGEFATLTDALERLKDRSFALIVLSASLTEVERERIQAFIPPAAQTLVLDHFMAPQDLLASVAQFVPLN